MGCSEFYFLQQLQQYLIIKTVVIIVIIGPRIKNINKFVLIELLCIQISLLPLQVELVLQDTQNELHKK
jgi:hypothetical protein